MKCVLGMETTAVPHLAIMLLRIRVRRAVQGWSSTRGDNADGFMYQKQSLTYII
jgi:hypothetical protein